MDSHAARTPCSTSAVSCSLGKVCRERLGDSGRWLRPQPALCSLGISLVLLIAVVSCKNEDSGAAGGTTDGATSMAGKPDFEGTWVLTASATGNKTLDDMSRKNLNNYHRRYALTLEGGEYFFQGIADASGAQWPKEKLRQEGTKLVSGDKQTGRVEYQMVDGRLVARYFHRISGIFSHQVTFEREE